MHFFLVVLQTPFQFLLVKQTQGDTMMTNQTVIHTGFLRLPQVLQLIPVSRSTWWAGVQSGIYPKPVKISTRITAWRAEDIYALIEHLSNQVEV